jgi:lipid II:glycine glycyltransferase (peptidoglycan interpeptide bridge formation enzyme)
MVIRSINIQNKDNYNKVVNHPLQSWEWGEFRERTGLKIIRRGIYINNKLTGAFQLTLHPVPKTPYTIGYLPKGEFPTGEVIEELQKIGKEEKCIFIQLEPNIYRNDQYQITNDKYQIVQSAHPLFTKYTFILDLTKSEEQLLKSMHPKTRYNIKVARKHGVEVQEDNSPEAFRRYWQLTEETTKRQGFYAHTKRYHQLQWELFGHQLSDVSYQQSVSQLSVHQSHKTDKQKTEELETGNRKPITDNNKLTSHLFTARYQDKILTTMLFFVFKDTLYYPYGASSNQHRNVMHSTLTMWEAIRFGKKLGLKKFDMWGALGTDPDPKDSWIGFHTFKQRYGPEHVEFIGSYDLIINPLLYHLYVAADKLRWLYLKIIKK